MSIFGPPNVEKMKTKRDVQGLIRALRYKEGNVRRDAAEALGQIGDNRAVEPLIAALRDAVWALGQPGNFFTSDPLITALRNEHSFGFKAAAEALGLLKDPRAIEPLIAVLGNASWQVRNAAAEALGQLGDNRAVEPLIAALKDKEEFVLQSAAEALGRIGDNRAVEPLIAALRDNNEYVRKASAEALDKLGWKPGKDATGATYWIARGHGFFNNCVAIGAPAVEPLIAALRCFYSFEDKRQAVAEVLVTIGKLSVEPLITALRHHEYSVCDAVADVLGEIGDSRAVEPLLTALRDGDNLRERLAATTALGKLGDPRAIEPLITVLRTGVEMGLRRCAARALVRLYSLEGLGLNLKQLIFCERALITSPVHDYHHDSHDSCGKHDDKAHDDTGIGVDFPL